MTRLKERTHRLTKPPPPLVYSTLHRNIIMRNAAIGKSDHHAGVIDSSLLFISQTDKVRATTDWLQNLSFRLHNLSKFQQQALPLVTF